MPEDNFDTQSKNLPRKDSFRYFHTNEAQIHNWIAERTDPAESKARRVIYGEMLVDGFLNDIRNIYDNITQAPPREEPVIIGSPSFSAINGVESLLNKKGYSVDDPGQVSEVTIEGVDSVTGEAVITTVGIGNEEGHIIYFGEEKKANGEIISRAVIDTGHSYETGTEKEGAYKYRLELHYQGGRYKDNDAEIDIDSSSSPRATSKTLELLTGVIRKSQSNQQQ
jgi:hypothetical protein